MPLSDSLGLVLHESSSYVDPAIIGKAMYRQHQHQHQHHRIYYHCTKNDSTSGGSAAIDTTNDLDLMFHGFTSPGTSAANLPHHPLTPENVGTTRDHKNYDNRFQNYNDDYSPVSVAVVSPLFAAKFHPWTQQEQQQGPPWQEKRRQELLHHCHYHHHRWKQNDFGRLTMNKGISCSTRETNNDDGCLSIGTTFQSGTLPLPNYNDEMILNETEMIDAIADISRDQRETMVQHSDKMPIFQAEINDIVDEVLKNITNRDQQGMLPQYNPYCTTQKEGYKTYKSHNDENENEQNQYTQRKKHDILSGKVQCVVRRLTRLNPQRVEETIESTSTISDSTSRKSMASTNIFGSTKTNGDKRHNNSNLYVVSTNEPEKTNVGKFNGLNSDKTNGRVLFTYKTWDGKANRWRPTKAYMVRKNVTTTNEDNTIYRHFRISLSRGGEVNVFPNLLTIDCVNQVKKELLESKFWRKYSIQGGDEPRLHFLAHDDATDDFENGTQPGYRYANITMKARSLSAVPKLQKLSKELAKLRNIPGEKWNIGVHPVLYRDNRDSMGDHADDDQGETRILCVLLDSPPTPRKVLIKVFDKLTGGKRKKDRVYQDGDEMVELQLRPGDAYEMDGVMQEFYSHCVPKDQHDYEGDDRIDKNSKNEQIRRICVVLRTGQQKHFERDTGESCIDLSPRKPISYHHGNIVELEEGCSYTRRELGRMNAHQLLQRGISGTSQAGADAIIISGKRNGEDNLDTIKYVAEWKIGANALFKSFTHQLTIRVFRSLEYIRRENALGSGVVSDHRRSTSKLYRYDGLYTVVQVKPPTEPRGTFEFFLTRNTAACIVDGGYTTMFSRILSKRVNWDLFRFSAKRKFPSNSNIQQEEEHQHQQPSGGESSLGKSTTDSKRLKSKLEYNRVPPATGIPLNPSWAEDYGPKDLSCCATLLLFGKELSTIHTLACALLLKIKEEKNQENLLPPPQLAAASDRPIVVARPRPTNKTGTAALQLQRQPQLPPSLAWPTNTRFRDGRRFRIRMYTYKPLFPKPRKSSWTAKKNKKKPNTLVAATTNRKVTRSMTKRIIRRSARKRP